MIKIIKKGTRQQATCDNCGCVFSYESEDVKHWENYNCESSNLVDGIKPGYKHYVVCPQCNHDFIIGQTR